MADLTTLPTTLIAGDSYTILLGLPLYPVSGGWSLSWTLAGASVATITSAPVGEAHRLTVTPAASAALIAGEYQTALRAIRTGVVTTIHTAPLTVTPDLSALAPGEGVSYWATLKVAAEAALTALMDGGAVQMVMIAGRQTMFRSPKDCLAVIAMCETRIAARSRGASFSKVSVGFRL